MRLQVGSAVVRLGPPLALRLYPRKCVALPLAWQPKPDGRRNEI